MLYSSFRGSCVCPAFAHSYLILVHLSERGWLLAMSCNNQCLPPVTPVPLSLDRSGSKGTTNILSIALRSPSLTITTSTGKQ